MSIDFNIVSKGFSSTFLGVEFQTVGGKPKIMVLAVTVKHSCSCAMFEPNRIE